MATTNSSYAGDAKAKEVEAYVHARQGLWRLCSMQTRSTRPDPSHTSSCGIVTWPRFLVAPHPKHVRRRSQRRTRRQRLTGSQNAQRELGLVTRLERKGLPSWVA